MKKLGLVFSLLLCCQLVFSQTMYLSAGPSVATDAPQGQPAVSYSFVSANEISVVLVTGAMSPELIMAVATGTGFSKMELRVYDAQNKISTKIIMQNVLVTSYQTGSGLHETVTLSFSKVRTKEFNH